MNRRTAITATLAALVATPVAAQEERTPAVILRELIDTVIVQGDTTDLGRFVTEDVEIVERNLKGIAAFRAASQVGYDTREALYSTYDFGIVSIIEYQDWAHALVRFTADGDSQSVFYVARFRGDLISEFYY